MMKKYIYGTHFKDTDIRHTLPTYLIATLKLLS